MTNQYPYILPILSAILLGTSYIPFPPWAIFFFLLPVLLFIEQQKRLLPILLGVWIMHFVAGILIYNSAVYLIHTNFVLSWPRSILLFVFFSIIFCYPSLLAVILWFFSRKLIERYLRQSPIRQCCIWGLLPTFNCLLLEYCPVIFEIGMGYAWMYAGWPAFQTAEIWGFKFLNTLTFFMNFLIFAFYKNIKNKRGWIIFGTIFLFFASLNMWGMWLKHRQPEADKHLTVLIMQPYITPKRHHTESYKRTSYFRVLEELHDHISIHSVMKPIDFILWPEGSFLFNLPRDKNQETPFHLIIKNWSIPVVMTTLGDGEEGESNSVFVFNKNGRMVQGPYNKNILLAFGEYIPLKNILPMNKFFPDIKRSLIRGDDTNSVIELEGVKLGFSICYEVVYDYYIRHIAKKKPHLLVTSSNDAWFGHWQAPEQHLYSALARAIENRLPVLRGTNSGISAFISHKGDILFKTTKSESLYTVQDISYVSLDKHKATLFASWGYYINQIFLWAMCIAILFYSCALTGLKSTALISFIKKQSK